MSNGRPLDIVAYGATGFTGRLVTEYLAKRLEETGIRWGIAGRNRDRLLEVQASGERHGHAIRDAEIIVASPDDPASLVAMASRTRAVLSTVGPFARLGEPLVKACVEARAHYADITGEPAFVAEVLGRYDRAAQDAGVRIVNCCGFDSVPHDLGALFTVRQLPRNQPIKVEAFVRARGAASGGTWHSAVEALGHLRSQRGRKMAPTPPGRKVRGVPMAIRYDREAHAWSVPLPTIDPTIVLRSARAMDDYGPDFRYAHSMHIKRTTTLIGTLASVGAVIGLAQFRPTRNLLLRFRAPGEGPDEAARARNWFAVTFRGTTPSARVVTRVSGGDPGYGETARMASESVLALALDDARLPRRWGVLTPAAAMGDALTERLKAIGIKFEVLEGAAAGRGGANVEGIRGESS